MRLQDAHHFIQNCSRRELFSPPLGAGGLRPHAATTDFAQLGVWFFSWNNFNVYFF